MEISFSSAVVILLLVMDPIGNIPLFVSLLRDVDPARRNRVIVRECAIAFAVLLAFVLSGRTMSAQRCAPDKPRNAHVAPRSRLRYTAPSP